VARRHSASGGGIALIIDGGEVSCGD